MTTDDNMEDLQVTYPGAGTFRLAETEGRVAHLNKLVTAGKKTATCLPWAEFEGDADSLPQVGRCDIIANWDGTPAAVVRTVSVDKVKFRRVTPAMALAEGEDADLDAWRKRTAKAFGKNGTLDPDTLLVFETFELVEDLGER
ncbi:ASCH domain-containing protein [Celeribacter arenosi]|uniref:ASCH domain-containing protein n=1 Tax=Celeribacter arenosi TaxID=792649 RepID=A0ABP7K114_9RHOB